MSLPAGHALAGLAVCLATRPRRDGPLTASAVAVALVVPVLPDLDFLLEWFMGCSAVVCRRTFTHALPTAAVVAALAAWAWGTRGRRWWTFGYAFLLVASHAGVDLLGGPNDRPPSGVALLWPFTGERFTVPSPLLPNVPLPVRSPWVLLQHWPLFLATCLVETLYFAPVLALLVAVKPWVLPLRGKLSRGEARHVS